MNPIVLADSVLNGSDLFATGVTDNTPYNLRDLRTYTWLEFPSGGTKHFSIVCSSPKAADCLGIIGHNLGTAAASVSVESSDDAVTWTPRLAAFTPTTDRAILKPFTTATALYWRLQVVTALVPVKLAVVMIGSRITFPFSPDKGFVPFSESVEADTNDSKTGNPLGVSVRFFPIDIKPVFSYPDRSFVDNTWRSFRESYGRLRKYFFWGWDLTTYPDHVFYVYDAGRFDPPVSRLAYYDRLSLELKGVAER